MRIVALPVSDRLQWRFGGAHGRPARTLLALALTLTGTLALVAAAVQWRSWSTQAAQATVHAQRIESALAAESRRVQQMSATQGPAQEARSQAHALPWQQGLDALEHSHRQEVRLSSLQLDGKSQEWRLVTQANELTALLAWADRVRRQPAVLRLQPLKQVQRADGADGAAAWEITWTMAVSAGPKEQP